MMLRIRRSAAPGRVNRNARARVEDMLVPDAALTILTNLMHLVAVPSHLQARSPGITGYRSAPPLRASLQSGSFPPRVCSVRGSPDTPQCQRTYLLRESRYGQILRAVAHRRWSRTLAHRSASCPE